MKLEDKLMLAAKRYLEHVGYTIINDNFMNEDIIVTKNLDNVVFVDVFDNFDEDNPMSRKYFEQAVHRFFEENYDIVNVPVRYDIIAFDVISDDRAIIRHIINAGLED